MHFLEVSIKEFRRAHEKHSELQKDLILGYQGKVSYEVLENSVEHAHFIFETKEQALNFISTNYPKCDVYQQLDLFGEVITN